MNDCHAHVRKADPYAGRAHRAARWCASLVVSLSLAACGGGGTENADQAALEAASRISVLPLLDDEGLAMPSTVAPADPAVRTRAQRYASVAQAEMLVAALGPAVVQVEVGCCAADVISVAVQDIAAARAAHDAQGAQTVQTGGPAMVPVLVRGNDQRQAALVADRLAEERMATVFLVTR